MKGIIAALFWVSPPRVLWLLLSFGAPPSRVLFLLLFFSGVPSHPVDGLDHLLLLEIVWIT